MRRRLPAAAQPAPPRGFQRRGFGACRAWRRAPRRPSPPPPLWAALRAPPPLGQGLGSGLARGPPRSCRAAARREGRLRGPLRPALAAPRARGQSKRGCASLSASAAAGLKACHSFATPRLQGDGAARLELSCRSRAAAARSPGAKRVAARREASPTAKALLTRCSCASACVVEQGIQGALSGCCPALSPPPPAEPLARRRARARGRLKLLTRRYASNLERHDISHMRVFGAAIVKLEVQ